MGRTFACPEGATTCNDVSATSALLLFFPGVVLLAFLLAWPLRRLVPRRRVVGATIAMLAAVTYLYFSSTLPAVSLVSFAIATIGLALSGGTREQRSDVRTT